ncbi:MAG: polyprenyl synthetase family protein [Clostridia bacterium]|nr:polyprenyl synthetase family protein [Clostridia bacterium]
MTAPQVEARPVLLERRRRGLDAALRAMSGELLRLCMEADAPLREGLMRLVSAGGKRLRPSLAYWCWRMAGEAERDVLPLMLMLELMHTASLIHDDIVDGAGTRRGCPALHTLVGERAAVQGADYLLARAMERLGAYRGRGVNECLTAVSIEMCRGELWQREALRGRAEQTEESYFVQIRRKTAGLIEAACRCGVLAASRDGAMAERLAAFGLNLGMAFQLRDDLLDFTGEGLPLKPAGLDGRGGIRTLPALRMAAGASRAEAVRETEGMIRARTAEAVAALDSFDCPEAGALRALAGQMAKRCC